MPSSTMSIVFGTLFQVIPPQILKAVFKPELYQTTIDQRIMDEVVYKRVLQDTNLIGGFRRKIEMRDEWLAKTIPPDIMATVGSTDDIAFFVIPPEARENRNISSVIKLSTNYPFAFPINTPGGAYNNWGNNVEMYAQAALASRTFSDLPFVPPQAIIRSGNILEVYPYTYLTGVILDCELEFDIEYTNMSRTMIPALRDLVVWATKAYIFNQQEIIIDTNEVIQGMTIGAYKTIISRYEDANERYEEALNEYIAGDLMDPTKFQDLVQSML